MVDAGLMDRLSSLPTMDDVPASELEWLVENGQYDVYEPGVVIGPKNKPLKTLWIVLSGYIAIRVDRGAGPRRVLQWQKGDVTGKLPYSRMIGPPGDNYIESRTELLSLSEDQFPELIHRCPVFTERTVHMMLDRARSFNTSALQDEKMISLGKLAAGLAHELNNPASAILRNADLINDCMNEADAAALAVGSAGITDEMFAAIEQFRYVCLSNPLNTDLSPIDRADREDEISEWLLNHRLDPDFAGSLADTAASIETLDALASKASPEILDVVFRWISTGSAARGLALDIRTAATRIHDLVAAVKNFTYMDQRGGPESVDLASGLRDTVRVLASKAKMKGAVVTVTIEDNLPRVQARGSELNQVWMNLIDNALDAVSDSGQVEITANSELDRVVVHIVDNGEGIPSELRSQIFDPFVTTKPPGHGMGLGLEIARRIIRMHQGEIKVDSRPGRTDFRVELAAI